MQITINYGESTHTALKTITALGPIILSLTAIAVSLWTAHKQRQIQQRQLKVNLFDKRLAIYEATQQFILGMARSATSLEAAGHASEIFTRATAPADFLFKPERRIPEFLQELRTDLGNLALAKHDSQNSPSPETAERLTDLLLKTTKHRERASKLFAEQLQIEL